MCNKESSKSVKCKTLPLLYKMKVVQREGSKFLGVGIRTLSKPITPSKRNVPIAQCACGLARTEKRKVLGFNV